jgi:hypothetical protein
MPRPTAPHLRVSFRGTLGRNVPAPEIFSFGLALAGGVGAGEPAWLTTNQAGLKALAQRLQNSFDVLASAMSNAASLQSIMVSAVGVDGLVRRTADGAYQQGEFIGARPGGVLHNGQAFQTALAISLRSRVAGPTGRGRFYLPLPAALSEAENGLISVVRRFELQNVALSFARDVNTAGATIGEGVRLVVASSGSVVRNLPPAANAVVEIGVGRALDTIRTRRNALGEGTTFATLA